MAYCLYEVDKEKRIATITFNKPEKLHAITPPHDSQEVIDLISQADRDDNVAVIVFKGSGKCYGAGYDLKSVREVRGFHEEKRPSQRRRWKGVDDWWGRRAILQKIISCDKATISQVHGYCYGGHLEIMFACDLAVASEDATFTHPGYTYIGVEGPIPLYVLCMGWRKVKEMMLIGKTLTAAEAHEFGMINKVVPTADLEVETMKWAEIIGQRPLDGIVIGKKEFLIAMDFMGLSAGYELATFSHSFMSNLKFGENEFNLMKELRDGGKKGMYKTRDAKVKREGEVMKKD